MVRRHFTVLAPLAVLVAAIAGATDLLVLSASGTLTEFASGTWVTDLLDDLAAGRSTSLPPSLYVSVLVSTAISLAGGLWLAGIAAAYAGADATGPGGSRLALARLPRRILPALVVAVIVAATATLGSLVLIVPGLVAYLVWAMATPVSVMEGAGTAAALARSTRLTRGHRWRILGTTLLVLVIGVAIDTVVSSLALTLANITEPVAALVASTIVTALSSSVTTSWIAAVIALLYVDIRIRTENLASALRAQGAA